VIREADFCQSIEFFLAPIADLMEDASVSEVMINGPSTIYVERAGRMERVSKAFPDERSLLALVRTMAQYSGKRVTAEDPRFDGHLPDGSRIHVVLPPVAKEGITVSIRKFSGKTITLERLVELGSLSPALKELLEIAVLLQKNVVVSGGTGSGKTSFLNALSGAIPSHERIVVLEDTSELRLQQEHVVRLEARSADRHGRGQVTIRDLLHSALRLRPDRVIVGECRGGEAFDMIQAMNTGHAGSMTTVHANSPRDALARIETLALLAGVHLPLVPLRAQVASAVHLVLHIGRLPDGRRKVLAAAEVSGLDADGRYRVETLASFRPTGKDDEGHLLGEHVLATQPPSFWEEVLPKGHGAHVKLLAGAWA
jgi:pilus assembly protein CpaF